MNKYVVLGFVFINLLGINAYADLVDDWSKNPEVRGAKISPQGDYLAVVKDEDDQQVVAVFSFPAMKLLNVVDFPGRSEVGNYWWVNDERLLFQVNVDWGNREDDVSYGELYAVNADGKKGKYLYGLRGNQLRDTKSRVNSVQTAYARASFTHPMWESPKQVLITLNDFTRGFSSSTSTAVLDVYTGRLNDRLIAPAANAQILTDAQGNPRFSFHTDDDQNTVIHQRDPKSGQWTLFSKAAYGESTIEPLRIHTDGRIFVTKSEDGGPSGLYLMDPLTKEFEELYQHDTVDVMSVYRDELFEVYGAYSMPAKLQQVFTNAEHPNAQLIMALKDIFPGAATSVSSSTHDFNLSIIRLTQDVRTPEFYLYNRSSGQLQQLFDAMPWIDDNLLSVMEPIEITARDGQELHGYLTIPRGAQRKNLPLVIVPHGGPHGPRDEWGYQWFEGFIPAAGYAMLQINYRGSGGYGQAFENMGHGEWDKKMQDDLTDSVRWAVEQGYADPERLCIFGWSYGGYAAAMSIVREPDLYKCSVAGAGVYDHNVQYDGADFTGFTRWGKKYLDKVIGPSKEERTKASPATYVDQIKTPLLLVHGEDDVRVPVKHAYFLQNAMKAAGKPVPELIELPNEGHTPRKEANNLRWRRATIDFIEQHIGPGVKPKAVASLD